MAPGHYILQEFKKGNLTPFYQDYYPGFVLFARRFLMNEYGYMAEDIVQDTVVKAWEIRSRFDNHNAFKSFMYTAIKNRIINTLQRKDVECRHNIGTEASMDFEQAMIDQEAINLLHNAALGLSPTLTDVYKLSFLENRKISEVSEMLDIPERTVKKYRADILTFFRAKLGDLFFLYFF